MPSDPGQNSYSIGNPFFKYTYNVMDLTIKLLDQNGVILNVGKNSLSAG